jgi:hypothetical protein
VFSLSLLKNNSPGEFMKYFFYFLLILFINVSLYSQTLTGVYQIGASGNYSSLTDALDSAFARGISGNVTFLLSSDYNSASEVYPIRIKNIQGLSESSNLLIRPSENSNEIILSTDVNNTLILDNCSYVTIDGNQGNLIIQNTSSTFGAIRFTNDASNNQLTGLKIKGMSESTVLFSSGIFTGCNYNKITSCTITGVSDTQLPDIGIKITGNLPVSKGNIIDQCSIVNFKSDGIYITGLSDSTIIRNCSFYQTSPVNSVSVNAIRYDQATNVEIFGNRITGFASTSVSNPDIAGIFIDNMYENDENTSRIFNNFISLNPDNEASKATLSGIRFNGIRGYKLEAYNNTILISGEDELGRSSYCINKQGIASVFNVYNNILVNQRVTMTCPGKQYCFYAPNISGILSDNNNFYNGINPPFIGNWEGADVYIIEDWVNISKTDSSSLYHPVSFISNTDLHLSGGSLGDIQLAGVPISNILTDIDGEPRHFTFPYKGADENLQYPLPVELISFSAEVTEGSVTLFWETASEINNYGFTVQRRSDNIREDMGFINGSNGTEKNRYSFSDIPGEGEFYYRLKQTDFDGSYTYSSEIKIDLRSILKYSLLQNYPNPFNPETVIEFTLPEKSFTSLKVYDTAGQLISTVVSKELDKGYYKLNFSGGKLSTGVYFYELVSGTSRIIKKMCLIK